MNDDDNVLKALHTALERAEDMFRCDDGQAYKEYERVRAQLHDIAGKTLPADPDVGYEMHVTQMPDAEFEFDDYITLACAHRRYSLGDPEGMHDFISFLERRMGEVLAREDVPDSLFTDDCGMELQASDYGSQQAILNLLDEHGGLNGATVKPLYLYDHSGLAISTNPFHCPWDSGQVGYVFCEEDTVNEEIIDSYVKTYDEYLRGGVFQYVVFDRHNEIVDGCCGFYGTDIQTNGMRDHLPDHVREYLDANPDKIKVGVL